VSARRRSPPRPSAATLSDALSGSCGLALPPSPVLRAASLARRVAPRSPPPSLAPPPPSPPRR
jgi:hypothetical protein